MRSLLALVWVIHLADGWSLAPGPIEVEENITVRMKRVLHKIQSDKPSVVTYTIQGSEEEVSPFELEIDSRGPGIPVASLKLKNEWTVNGNRVNSLDREQKSSYTLIITAMNEQNVLQEQNQLTIKVTDQNDMKPEFTPASKNLRCEENIRPGTVCGTVQAIDQDESGEGTKGYGNVEYAMPLIDEEWYTVDDEKIIQRTGVFKVDRETGEVSITQWQDWDREKYKKVVLMISATDSPWIPTSQNTVTVPITITIEDVNDEKATFGSDCGVELNVDENLANAKLLIPGESFTFRGEDNDATEPNNLVFFKFDDDSNDDIFHLTTPDKKNQVTMSTKVPLDYETKNRYVLRVRSFNKNAEKQINAMEDTCDITITVNDVNEPPKWSDNVPVFTEGDKKGTQSKVHPMAEDLDVQFASDVRYGIVDDPEHYFEINSETGVLTVITLQPDGLDRECPHCEDGHYTLVLEACDDQNLCAEHKQRVKIIDVNDQAPGFVNFPGSVCQAPADGVLIDNLKAVDTDDCSMPGHCGRIAMAFTGHGYQGLFDLEPLTETDYKLKLKEGKTLSSSEYQIEITGTEFNAAGTIVNERVYIYTIKACSCQPNERTPSECNLRLSGASGNSYASIWAILLLLVVVFIVVALLLVRRKRQGDNSKDGLLDDLDDERATVMVYSTEGGGEEDQTNYNTATLMKARPMMKEKPIKPKHGLSNSIPPEDIGQYISAAKEHADQDVHAAPYDSLLTFDYEGNNSIIDDLSSTSSVDDFGEFDPDNDIAQWGPKFRKLAELYAGRENEAFEP